ncbi:hypothetical protein H4R33_003392 [Dimargaris cristalligena]|nr:hypothetical protein H4R33_003392 [Dimargaris cristalligena]
MDWDQDILSSGKPAWEGDPASRTAADGEESGDTSSLDNLFQKRVCLSIVDQGTTTSCQLTELHTIPAVFERLRKSGRVTQTDRSELWALVMQIRPSPDVVTYLHGLLSTLPWPQARYLLYQFIMGDGELPPAPAATLPLTLTGHIEQQFAQEVAEQIVSVHYPAYSPIARAWMGQLESVVAILAVRGQTDVLQCLLAMDRRVRPLSARSLLTAVGWAFWFHESRAVLALLGQLPTDAPVVPSSAFPAWAGMQRELEFWAGLEEEAMRRYYHTGLQALLGKRFLHEGGGGFDASCPWAIWSDTTGPAAIHRDDVLAMLAHRTVFV